jgi:hypothetical protein
MPFQRFDSLTHLVPPISAGLKSLILFHTKALPDVRADERERENKQQQENPHRGYAGRTPEGYIRNAQVFMSFAGYSLSKADGLRKTLF